MTYFGFLLRFLVIPILIFLIITWRDYKNNKLAFGLQSSRTVWRAIFVHVILAVVYTTPWDNYLVATGVWYYNPDLVTGIIFGYVPIEEYTFFILETILAGLWWWYLAGRMSQPTQWFTVNKPVIYVSATIFTIAWTVFTITFFSDNQPLTYLSITLFWALPPIILQLLYGADILWHHKKLVLTSILLPSLYLSFMDMYAIRDTTWSISPEQTTGVLFFDILPLEEVVFFFVTNVLITFGITLLLSKESQSRLAYLKLLLRRSPNRESTSSN